ncbi:hypothetical protein PEDI_17690 [Persicobacter diffluens]|uniref:Uncharacterized protein n=1 Tax=Persicobacter diffluens TaxID=981 RepID=A0AAN4VYQ4_9BACT|nr:hypothetical protein PEDI_17690 [Persicobacter diffluens]
MDLVSHYKGLPLESDTRQDARVTFYIHYYP